MKVKIKLIKKFGAAICAATISVSMVSAMPVNAKSCFGWRSVNVREFIDYDKKYVYTVWSTVNEEGIHRSIHCGDLYTFTTSFLFENRVTVGNEPYEKSYGYTHRYKMDTCAVSMWINGKTYHGDDKPVDNLHWDPCQVGPKTLKGKNIKVYGYYEYKKA